MRLVFLSLYQHTIGRLMEDISNHQRNISSGNVERHFSNPVNAFIVTKSMHKLLNDSDMLVDKAAKKNLDGRLISQLLLPTSLLKSLLSMPKVHLLPKYYSLISLH